MRKFICIVLSLLLVVTNVVPAFATGSSETDIIFTTSDSGYLKISSDVHNETLGSRGSGNNKSFLIEQYEEGRVIQSVSGSYGGEYIVVTNYIAGKASDTELVLVADRVCYTEIADDVIASVSRAESRAVTPTTSTYLVGHIIYNQAVASDYEEKISVYATQTGPYYEAYTINGVATDTLAVIAGVLASVLSVFIPTANIWYQIAVAIVSAFGGSVAGGAIGIAFSEDVAVVTHEYIMQGYHMRSNRYSAEYDGAARRVITVTSKYYGEWFLEGVTPANWKDGDDLATWLWANMIGLIWPHVKMYIDAY